MHLTHLLHYLCYISCGINFTSDLMSLGYLADIQRICLLNLLAVEDGVTGQNDDDRGGSGDGFSVHLKTVRPTQLLPLTCSAAGIDPNTVSQLRV
jgi:hypothetical protein